MISSFIFAHKNHSMFFLFCLALCLVSCSNAKWSTAPNENGPTAPGTQKPGDEDTDFDSPQIYNWYFVQSFDLELGPPSPMPQCDSAFELDAVCSEPLFKCARGNSVYACYPKDLEVRITGMVMDEHGQPLRSADIFSQYPHGVLKSEWVAQSKANGNFLVKVINGCIPILSASKDGYVALSGRAHHAAITRCRADQFRGAENVILQLKKAARTVEKNFPSLATGDECHLKGRVVDGQGRGLADVRVANGSVSSLTDSDGFYILKKAEPCQRFCEAHKKGYRPPFSPSTNRGLASCFSAEPADIVLEPVQ